MTSAAVRAPPQGFDPARGARKVTIFQGEHFVSADPETVIATLLGSCVAACLRDPQAGVGGMNHFLLPGGEGDRADGLGAGVHAMELLVNALLARGARRERLQAKLFGGARVSGSLYDVGRANGDFALWFLKSEGIAHLGGSLGGEGARRVQFRPADGRARQLRTCGPDHAVFAQERRRSSPSPVEAGYVELFAS